MRYFVRLGGRTRGPMDAEELVLLPGFGPARMVCPEGRDPHERRHWAPARLTPLLRHAMESREHWLPDAPALAPERTEGSPSAPPAAPPRSPAAPAAPKAVAPAVALILALGAAAYFLFPGAPASPPPRRLEPAAPEPPREISDSQVARYIVPACLAANGAKLPAPYRSYRPGGSYEMVLPADGRITLAEARFTFDSRTGAMLPLNAEARRLSDFRTACARR